jgi:hypothetical protein
VLAGLHAVAEGLDGHGVVEREQLVFDRAQQPFQRVELLSRGLGERLIGFLDQAGSAFSRAHHLIEVHQLPGDGLAILVCDTQVANQTKGVADRLHAYDRASSAVLLLLLGRLGALDRRDRDGRCLRG